MLLASGVNVFDSAHLAWYIPWHSIAAWCLTDSNYLKFILYIIYPSGLSSQHYKQILCCILSHSSGALSMTVDQSSWQPWPNSCRGCGSIGCKELGYPEKGKRCKGHPQTWSDTWHRITLWIVLTWLDRHVESKQSHMPRELDITLHCMLDTISSSYITTHHNSQRFIHIYLVFIFIDMISICSRFELFGEQPYLQ